MCLHPRGSRAGWLALLACCLSGAWAQTELPLGQVVTEALARSASLRGAEQAAARARAMAEAAGVLPAARLLATPLISDQRGLDIEVVLAQPLYDATLRPAARAARAALAAALCDVAETRLEVTAQASAAWYGLAAAQRQAAATSQDVELARALRDAAAKAREVGERPGVDVLRAELEVGLTEQAQADADAALVLARGVLAGLLGRDLAEPLSAATAEPTWPALDRSALQALAVQRPRVKAARLRVDEARGLVALAKAGRAPGVAVEGFREDEEHGLRIAIDLPLLDYGRLGAQVRAAEASVAEAEQLLTAAQREVALAVDSAWLTAESALRRRASHASSVVARAQRLTDLTREGYQSGELSLLEVLDARRRLAEARVASVALDTAVATALLALRTAVGADLPETPPVLPAAVPTADAEPGRLGPPVPAQTLVPQALRPTVAGAP
ncbi:MAG: TolC family protein [Armatimonadetes bacterium]|nr:TolC family protein [Armatimonadota bacterium]